jgi:hypothetical protein
METGKKKETPRPASKDRLKQLPPEVVAECRQISEDIRGEKEDIREAKIIAAKIRIETDYYNSDNVLRIVASRLLDESERG